MVTINLLFEDRIDRNFDAPDDYVVTFGGNVIWRSQTSYYRDGEEAQLDEGRADFAAAFREVLGELNA